MRPVMKGVASLAWVGVALLSSETYARAGEDVRTARPTQGVVLDVGSKHTVSYFVPEEGRCNLTLMVGEKADENGENASVGARFRVAIEAGKSARIETAEGRSLEFSCAEGASQMSVRPLEVVAYRTASN
jgi:hypothetical protein